MIKLLTFILFLTALPASAQDFSIDTIPDAVFARMKGKSYKGGCPLPKSELRYLRIKHYDANGQIKGGEIICNRLIANELIAIFKELFHRHYPIERVQLIDDYEADDEQSMRANNTSCFNYRPIAGSTKLSAHARGMAIDINPLYNPCVRKRSDGSVKIEPATGRKYANRSQRFKYKIDTDDLCFKLFRKYGFTWGGTWKSVKDYQHFEK